MAVFEILTATYETISSQEPSTEPVAFNLTLPPLRPAIGNAGRTA